MKKVSCFFIIFCIIIVSSGCNFRDKPLRLSYDLVDEPLNLDPQTAKDNASLLIINNVFEGLFTYDEHGKLIKGMTSNYEISNDGLTYSFELRNDSKWNDDNDKTEDYFVTAHDFEFAFKRLLSKDTNSTYAKLFYCIKNARQINKGEMDSSSLGVKALEDYKLQISLEAPNENFLKMLSLTCTMPCNEEYFKNTNGRYGLEAHTIVSNGPFVISTWQHKRSIRIAKSESYHNKANVKPASVNFWIDGETPKKGEEEKPKEKTSDRLLDDKTLAGFIDGFEISKFKEKSFNSQPIENSSWGIVFNQNNTQLKNKNIRLAIASAFDRNSFKDTLPKNIQVSNAIVPNGVILNNNTYREYAGVSLAKEYNAEAAFNHYQKALKELEIKKISGIKILIPEDGVKHEDYFLYVSQILQHDLGIFISIDKVEQKEYEKRLKSSDFDCALVNLEVVNNSLVSVFEQFASFSKKNYSGYNNPQVDLLLNKAIEKTDINSSKEEFKKIEQILLDDAIFIPMYYKRDYFVVSNSVKGLNYNKENGLISFKDVKRNT